jgi:hypothetical protein
MDDAEANRFTERLDSPTGWLDQPRTEAEIPDSVSVLLAPAPRVRVRASAQDQASRAATFGSDEPDVSPLSPRASEAPSATSESEQALVLTKRQISSAKSVSASLTNEAEQAAETDAHALKGSGDRATRRALANADFPPASATSLQDLEGISPIAEALLKMLAGKARTGRVDELTALKLLHEAVLL